MSTWPILHSWANSAAVEMTGICSSAPPWIISSGAGIGVVNVPGSFALSSSFQAGIVAGSAFWSVEKSMLRLATPRSPAHSVSTCFSQSRPAGVSTSSRGAFWSP